MDEKRLSEIEARVDLATGGPWKHQPQPGPTAWDGITADEGTFMAHVASVADSDDANFISHARQDVPELLAEVRRLREFVSRVRKEHCACTGPEQFPTEFPQPCDLCQYADEVSGTSRASAG